MSSELLNQYNPEAPRAIGVGDSRQLREQRVQNSHSQSRVDGGNVKRKRREDSPRTNAQLRDYAVREPESRMQVLLHNTMHRSRITPDNEASVHARFEPVLTTTSTAFTPEKGMRNNGVRTAENVNSFARDRDSLAQQYEPLARALRENANITLESLTGAQIVQSLEGSGYNFHFLSDKDNGPGSIFVKKQRTRRNLRSNIVELPRISTDSESHDDEETSQDMPPTLLPEESFEDWESDSDG